MKQVFNSKSEKTHYATFHIKEGIGEIFKLLCSGREVYIPALVGQWAEVDTEVDCSQCLKKMEKMENIKLKLLYYDKPTFATYDSEKSKSR